MYKEVESMYKRVTDIHVINTTTFFHSRWIDIYNLVFEMWNESSVHQTTLVPLGLGLGLYNYIKINKYNK